MDFKLNNVTFSVKEAVADDLEKLYNSSSLTLEGLAVDSIKDWMNAVFMFIENTDHVDIFTVTGKLMNDHYRLTGDNSYPDDITIVAFADNKCFGSKLGSVAVDRFSYGGRWFDDIVDNNSRREKAK